MQIILGVLVLLAVIAVMTLFTFKAPKGKKAVSALSGAACATFLPQAFLSYAIGGVFHIDFVKQIGDTMGSMGGLAAGSLVPLAFGISPVFSILLGPELFTRNSKIPIKHMIQVLDGDFTFSPFKCRKRASALV